MGRAGGIMKRRIFLIVSFVGVLGSAFVGCGHKSERIEPSSLPAAPVRVQSVESKKRVATEDVVGTVRARLRSVIEAKVSGKVDQMPVVPGQQVKAGELLAHID